MSSLHTYSTPPKLDESKFAVLSWPQYVWMQAKLMVTPLVLAREILLSPFVARSKAKSLKRVVGDSSFRYLVDYFSEPELQSILGNSTGVYSTWARKESLPITIDELEDGGKLMWIGAQETGKNAALLSRYIQLQLEKRGLKVGIAIMSYSLVPVGQFPAPLWQTSRALEHLFSVEKVIPSNLVLVGDSAGGNLVSQVLSSMLHPLFSPPIIPARTRLQGAYMMSPWVSLTSVYTGEGEKKIFQSFAENDHCDVCSNDSLVSWGHAVLQGAPNLESDLPYLEPINAPEDWYKGLPDVVKRVFVSTGGGECLRDADRVFFEKTIKPYHGEAEYFEQEGGVHNDPFFDFQIADGPVGTRQSLTPKILEWVWKCFEVQ
ncbi:Alpha/Beta hydrolase protein [Lentinula aciculospora]|uniref:Alpha/Beta hydrolase protein n=1 Tax=Lentinula aciculospora TaxID=153920 RepID=A0A9W8ZUD7_9AGAR|nr:Alpha/Beta hydrolase protein [Lentinula aciculospora]